MIARKSTILLVEDQPSVQSWIKKSIELAHKNCLVVVFDNGEDARRYLNVKAAYADRLPYSLPALILTDIQMPKMTGLELLSWVKQQPGLKHLPVVVMSASGQRNEAMKLGAHSYFDKTSSIHCLTTTIKNALAYTSQSLQAS